MKPLLLSTLHMQALRCIGDVELRILFPYIQVACWSVLPSYKSMYVPLHLTCIGLGTMTPHIQTKVKPKNLGTQHAPPPPPPPKEKKEKRRKENLQMKLKVKKNTTKTKKSVKHAAHHSCMKMLSHTVHQPKNPSNAKAKYLDRKHFPFKISWWRGKTDFLERQLSRWSTKNQEYPKQAQQRTLKHHMSGRHKNITRNRTYLSASHKTQAVF